MIKFGVLASGEGSTTEAVYEAIQKEAVEGIELAFIICNNGPNSGKAGIWQRAHRLGIPIHHVSNKTQPFCTLPSADGQVVDGAISYEASDRIAELANSYGARMMVALGFMRRIIGRALLELPYANLHPGPLGPAGLTAGLAGKEVQEEVMRRQLPASGPTFHWMSVPAGQYDMPVYDAGAEIGHQPVPITDAMRQQWECFASVQILQDEVQRTERLYVPGWITKAAQTL